LPADSEEEKEIEFVMVINGTSYGALGWRPAGMDKSCKQFPEIRDIFEGLVYLKF